MSWEDTVVDTQPTEETKRAIRRGWDAYHASVFEYGPSDEWDRQVIDNAIRAMVQQREPFSVNSFRDLLPPVRTCLISRRLIAAQREGLIEWKGRVTPSNLESTKAASVKVYHPVLDDTREPAMPPAPRRKDIPPPVAVDDIDEPTLFELEAS